MPSVPSVENVPPRTSLARRGTPSEKYKMNRSRPTLVALQHDYSILGASRRHRAGNRQ